MLTNEFRPKVLDEVDGQLRAVDMLKRFAANHKDAPNCLLLFGPYGTGKTSAAKAFAHALNNITEPKDECHYIRELNCACLEYDANEKGKSVEKHLEDELFTPVGMEVVIFDEIQGANEYVQTSMLKYLEREHNKRFFVFCTTELNKVLDTLRSRCLPIEFKSISYDDVYKNLEYHIKKNGFNIPDNVIAHIATRCNGHMRDAHNELKACVAVTAEAYFSNATTYYGLIADMFIAAHKGDKDSLVKYLRELSFSSLFTIKQEFENFIIDCADAKYLSKQSPINDVNRLLDEYGDDFTDIVDFYAGIWDNSLFSSDRHFYMHMLSFFKDMEKKQVAK